MTEDLDYINRMISDLDEEIKRQERRMAFYVYWNNKTTRDSEVFRLQEQISEIQAEIDRIKSYETICPVEIDSISKEQTRLGNLLTSFRSKRRAGESSPEHEVTKNEKLLRKLLANVSDQDKITLYRQTGIWLWPGSPPNLDLKA